VKSTLLALGLWLAAYSPATDRGEVDFDRLYEQVLPYGAWQTHPDLHFVFNPKKNGENGWRPYRDGRWLYTDWGWTWQGVEPWSWATDHYGFWAHLDGKTWAWVPAPDWLPSTVEWLSSGDYVGWRVSQLDRFSNMLEPDDIRYTHPEEWNFVPKSKVTKPLKPEDFASDAQAAELLKKAGPLDHVFVAWREIPRPGPAPMLIEKESGAPIPVLTVMNVAYDAVEIQPANAKEVYFKRPKVVQDEDGVVKRCDILINGKRAETTKVTETLDPNAAAPTVSEQEAEAAKRKQERKAERDDALMQKLYK
jgi:hypothetical protein